MGISDWPDWRIPRDAVGGESPSLTPPYPVGVGRECLTAVGEPAGVGVVPDEPAAVPARQRTQPQRTWPQYTLTPAQVEALRELATAIEVSCMAAGVPADPSAMAAGLGDAAAKTGWSRRTRAAALLAAGNLDDSELEQRASKPGELRRPRRDTLAAWAAGLGLDGGVVDEWVRAAPGAIADGSAR